MKLDAKTIYKNLNLIILAAILIAAGLGFYFLKPKYDAMAGAGNQAKLAEDALVGEQDNLRNMKSLLKSYDSVKEQLHTLSLALPQAKDIPDLLVQLEALAVKNSVMMDEVSYSEEVADPISPAPLAEGEGMAESPAEAQTLDAAGAMAVSPAPVDPAGVYSTLNVSLSLSGKYGDFIQYLGDVQKNLRFLDVYAVDFSASSGSGSSQEQGEESGEANFEDKALEFQVELRTYYLK